MSRSFSVNDSKRLSDEHIKLKSALSAGAQQKELLREEIKKNTDFAVDEAVVTLLKSVSVEEINREKRGFRIKSLIDNGYSTVADIINAPEHYLERINGISAEGARAIKKAANEIAEQARQGTKLRFSTDNKTPAATALVLALYKYIKCSSAAESCIKLLPFVKSSIEPAVSDLAPATGSLKWLFTSSNAKAKAENAYKFLSDSFSGSYGRDAKAAVYVIDSAKALSSSEAWNNFSEQPVAFFNVLEDICPGVLGTDDGIYGLPEELAKEVREEPIYSEGLRCTLRRYQEWGVKYVLHQEKVLLGDEMGLGKTVQAIAAMVSLKNAGATHFIVVCPASVLANWCREIRKFCSVPVTRVYGNARIGSLRFWIKNGGIAVTTYETTPYFVFDDDFSFDMLVVDEAHYIKNPEAQRTANVKKLCAKSKRLLFMTGTALENNVDEMLSLMKILQPEVAASASRLASISSAPQFRDAIASVYYRRKRADVLTELPELIETEEWCTLLSEEKKVYEDAVLSRNFAAARRVSWNSGDMSKSCKALRLKEIVEDAAEDNRKVIVFSFFLDTIQRVTELFGEKCVQPINGSVPLQRRQEIVDEFEKAPAGAVLPAQIQSGGTGLNIQSASVVIICEPQFKPSIENQAVSRAYRMGQTRNVLVYRLLCEDSVDERITEILKEKQNIFDAFADESSAAAESLEIDSDSFGNIIDEEIKRINKEHASEENKQ